MGSAEQQTADKQKLKQILAVLGGDFDAAYYLEANQDVASSGMDAKAHFILSGMTEGRAPNAKSSASEKMEQVSGILGRLPTHTDLEMVFQTYRTSKSISGLLRRLAKVALKGLPIRRRRAATRPAAATVKHHLNLAAFNTLNAAGIAFHSREKAIRYMLETGYKTLDPIDFHLVPDLAFCRALHRDYRALSDAELYLAWLNAPVSESLFISESNLLRQSGARTTHFLTDFPLDAYKAAYSDIPVGWSDEQVLQHFILSGVREGRFSIPISAALLSLLEDVLEQLSRTDPSATQNAVQRLILAGARSPRLIILASRNAISSNQLIAALSLLEGASSNVPIEDFWLKFLRSDISKRIGDFGEAISYLERARRIEFASVWAENELESLQRQAFDAERHKAKRLAELGRVEEARDLLNQAIDATYTGLLPYGFNLTGPDAAPAAPPLTKRPLRVGMLSDLWLPQCRLYRVDQKIEQLEAAGAQVRMYDFRKEIDAAIQDAGLFDLWIIYRVPALFDPLRFVKTVNNLGRPTIYEIDDLLFDVEHFPEPIEAYGGNLSLEEYNGLQLSTITTAGLACKCSHGLASTETLAAELSRIVSTGKVIVHHNALSAPHQFAMDTARGTPARPNDDKVRIFYGSGTKAHKDFLEEVFFEALDEVMTQRPNVEFHAVGYVNAKTLKARHADRIFETKPIWDVQDYWSVLHQNDINVAVLKKSLLTDAKSEIKWLEAAMFAIPSVVSGTTTLRDAICDGETGCFADTKEEWVARLLDLVDDPVLRRAIGEAARARVLERYAIPGMSAQLVHDLTDILETAL